ncbi:MAG: hypothetical protein AAB917_01445, partial [Patescibacteria group bacterium]
MVKYLLSFLLVSLFVPKIAYAGDQFITIVNPVRISHYNSDPGASLASQYGVISDLDLPSTWLLTYDALNNMDVVGQTKKFSRDQEFGLILEVTPNFASDSKIKYKQTGSWHFGSSVFLTGYTQEERKLLIDTIFSKFKDTFGFYPKSVGAWWIDSWSLKYMKDKYGIISTLGCADQFATDNYQLWGQYWSTPFYPSASHAGVPASTSQSKIGIVTLQWAARHPRDGYESSLYSTQDYFTLPEKQTTKYFDQLLDIYLNTKNDFSQITV